MWGSYPGGETAAPRGSPSGDLLSAGRLIVDLCHRQSAWNGRYLAGFMAVLGRRLDVFMERFDRRRCPR